MSDPGFGIYIHWPFCRAKCPYCDFNSHVRDEIDQARWRAALLAELAHFAAAAPGRPVTSVFFGGGTPSLMEPATAEALISAIDETWGLDAKAEITLEANPTSSEAAAFAGFRAAGVNRLSLGVQALDDASLAFLGREHTADEALAAVALARKHFQRFSFDLIYARPGQTPQAWAAELARALDEGARHLSLYQLTIEENTVFHGMARRGELQTPGEGETAALYDQTQETLEAAGLPAYEISNHAAPGEECRHNLVYWRLGDYLGIGPGAHGRLSLEEAVGGEGGGGRIATRQHRAPEVWLQRVEQSGHATQTWAGISAEAQLQELLLMGLRLRRGLAWRDFPRALGAEALDVLQEKRLSALQAEGYLERDEAGLRATPEGLKRLDAVLAYLLA